MQLTWTCDEGGLTLCQAVSAAYRYKIRRLADGRAAISIRHAHADETAPPIKRFTYKTVPAARNGAQRFEDKHGYHEEEIDRINRLCAMAWDEGFNAGTVDEFKYAKPANPYRKTETTED